MALIDVIKYDGPAPEVSGEQTPWLVYKHPSDKIVLGAQLIVNKGQEAIFLKGGNALDIFGPGTHTLSTENLPILQKLINVPFGGQTPFTAEVYFINKTAKLDLKWGTSEPIQLTEPKYNIIVSVRSHGQFGMKISDSRTFATQIVGVLHQNQKVDHKVVVRYFKGVLVAKVKDTIAAMIVNKKMSVLEITANLDAISKTCEKRLSVEFHRFGIDILNFFVEAITIPDEDLARVKSILEDKAEFDILGDDKYAKKRSFDVLDSAASNEGGGTVGAGLGLGLGLGAGASAGGVMGELAGNLKVKSDETAQLHWYCGKCGSNNEKEAKFCSKCGEKRSIKQIKCRFCESENSSDDKFCSNCGKSLKQRTCTKCGSENHPGSNFCSQCGNNLEK